MITNLFIFFVFCAFIVAIRFLVREIIKQRQNKLAAQQLAPYDPPTKRYLIEMFHGDRQAVERLMDAKRVRQPGKPECWYAEKVLHDLKRDRR